MKLPMETTLIPSGTTVAPTVSYALTARHAQSEWKVDSVSVKDEDGTELLTGEPESNLGDWT